MAMLKSCILQNFATIGIPDFEEDTLHQRWSIVALSQNLIDEVIWDKTKCIYRFPNLFTVILFIL